MNTPNLSAESTVFRSNRGTKLLFAIFGTFFCFNAVIIQFVSYDNFRDRVLAFLLLTLPVGAFGLYFLRAWWLLRQARVVVSEQGVDLNIPNFKAGWLFQSVPVQLRWAEICGVARERHLLIAGGKPIDEYWIHSGLGSFVLTKHICSDPAEVARLIAARKGYELAEAPPSPSPQPTSPEQEEIALKRNAVAVLLILFGLMLGITLIVIDETPVGQMLLSGLTILSHLSNLFFIVVTVAGILGLWLKARRERLILKRKIN